MDSLVQINTDNIFIKPDVQLLRGGAELVEADGSNQNKASLAIVEGISIYEKDYLPFNTSTSNPLFQGVKIRVDCINCLANCVMYCPAGNILNVND
jgi:hypothetical protein